MTAQKKEEAKCRMLGILISATNLSLPFMASIYVVNMDSVEYWMRVNWKCIGILHMKRHVNINWTSNNSLAQTRKNDSLLIQISK